jgi:hypothetical protein
VDQAWEKRHEKWEKEEEQEEQEENARIQLLSESIRHASDAKDMSSLEVVKTQFNELFVKCNYTSVLCMNIRDMFIRTCQNATKRLTECPTC